jgi:hypothetical protein
MRAPGWVLAIDFGTTHTCAAVVEVVDLDAVGGMSRLPPPVVLDIEGERRFPSLVVVDGEGKLRTGRAARNLLRRFPRQGERTPKRHLGSDMLAIGVSPVEAAAAVLQRVAEEARQRFNGTDPARVILTHPVRFEDLRRQRLLQAADLAGLPGAELVPEPVAAAFHYAGRHPEVGALVAVYDLGGGTYDTAVLRGAEGGFALAGEPGGNPDIGGERFDDLLLALVGGRIAELDADLWTRLTDPGDRDDEREGLELQAEVREAKELLSHERAAEVHVGALDRSVRLTREEFERLIGQAVADTAAELERTLESAGVKPKDLDALYLTGDSTRIPAISRALHQRFSPLEPSRFDDPKAVVALGALRRVQLEAEEEARRRIKAEEDRKRRAEKDARRRAEEEERRRKAEEKRRRSAAEEARKKAEEEARRRRAAGDSRKKAEVEERRRRLASARKTPSITYSDDTRTSSAGSIFPCTFEELKAAVEKLPSGDGRPLVDPHEKHTTINVQNDQDWNAHRKLGWTSRLPPYTGASFDDVNFNIWPAKGSPGCFALSIRLCRSGAWSMSKREKDRHRTALEWLFNEVWTLLLA